MILFDDKLRRKNSRNHNIKPSAFLLVNLAAYALYCFLLSEFKLLFETKSIIFPCAM